MAIQIPRGDNLGNVSPQTGRTRLQGGNGVVGRAIAGLGREVQHIALQIEAENEQLNQVHMGNAVLEYEKKVTDLKNNIDEQVRLGKLDPDKAPDEYLNQLNAIPKAEINGLTRYQRDSLNYSYSRVGYSGQQQVFSVAQQGRVVKAQTQVSELTRNAKENNYTPEQFSSMLNSEPVRASISLGWGLQGEETRASIERGYTVDYLQNQIMTSSDNSNYQSLQTIRKNVKNPDYYKGILQEDDRVKLAHGANIGLDRIESKWKAAQTQAKLVAKEQYDNLNDSLYWQMSKEGKLFSELDQNQLALLKPKDYEFFKNYKTVKSDNFNILEDATFKINNQEDIDLNSPLYRKNLTSSTIESLAKKKANLAANQEKANTLFSTVTLFNTRARAR